MSDKQGADKSAPSTPNSKAVGGTQPTALPSSPAVGPTVMCAPPTLGPDDRKRPVPSRLFYGGEA